MALHIWYICIWCSAYTNAYAVCESEAKIGLDVCVGASEVNGIPMPPSPTHLAGPDRSRYASPVGPVL